VSSAFAALVILQFVLYVTRNFAHAILSGYKRRSKAFFTTDRLCDDLPWRSATRMANG
jgi:hypothetical protein